MTGHCKAIERGVRSHWLNRCSDCAFYLLLTAELSHSAIKHIQMVEEVDRWAHSAQVRSSADTMRLTMNS